MVWLSPCRSRRNWICTTVMLRAVSCTLKQSSKNFIIVSAGNFPRSCSIIDRTTLEQSNHNIYILDLTFISNQVLKLCAHVSYIILLPSNSTLFIFLRSRIALTILIKELCLKKELNLLLLNSRQFDYMCAEIKHMARRRRNFLKFFLQEDTLASSFIFYI